MSAPGWYRRSKSARKAAAGVVGGGIGERQGARELQLAERCAVGAGGREGRGGRLELDRGVAGVEAGAEVAARGRPRPRSRRPRRRRPRAAPRAAAQVARAVRVRAGLGLEREHDAPAALRLEARQPERGADEPARAGRLALRARGSALRARRTPCAC